MGCCTCCCLAVNGECCGPPGEKTCCKEPRVCCGSGEEQVCCAEGYYCCQEKVCCESGRACCGPSEDPYCCPEGQECVDGECEGCEPYTCGSPPDLSEYSIYNDGISPGGDGNLLAEEFGELFCKDENLPPEDNCFDSFCEVAQMEHSLLWVSDCGDDPEEEYKITVTVSLIITGWVGGGDITSPQIASSTRQFTVTDCDGVPTLVPTGSATTSGYDAFCDGQNEFLDGLLSQDNLTFNPLP